MNLLILDYINKPNFRIDMLIPNYRILKKVKHKTYSPFLLTSVQKETLMKAEEENEIFPIILEFLNQVFQQTLKIFLQQLRKELVPKKMLISQMVKKFIEDQIKSWSKNELLNQISKKFQNQLIDDLNVFIYSLTSIQNYYTTFFTTKYFELIEKQDILDTTVNLNWFVSELSEQILDFLKYSIETTEGLTYDYILTENVSMINDLTLAFNHRMAQLYTDCQRQLKEEIQFFTQRTDDCTIINKYLMVGLIQELSACTYDIVDSYQQYSPFYYSEQDVKEEFARFIVHNFDHMDIVADNTPIEKAVFDISTIEMILSKKIKKGTKILTHQVMRKVDRRRGIMIETQDHEQQNFVIHREKEQIIITNAKLILNHWTFIQVSKQDDQNAVILSKQDLQQEYNSIESAIQGKEFRKDYDNLQLHQNYDEGISLATQQAQQNTMQLEFSHEIQHQIQNMQVQAIRPAEFQGGFMVVTAAGDIGQSLGQCLANINRYHSRKAFLIDFGETAMINGSITLIVLQMPLLGKLIAVGGLGYFSMKIYKNQTASRRSKMRQFNKLVIGTSASLGSSIGGAMIGQALIPVPILGAFIGGVIGGLVGGVSTNNLFDYMNDKRAQQIVNNMENQLQEDHWTNLELLNLMGLSKQYFIEQCPITLKHNQQRDIRWFNLIINVFLTVFYSQKEQKEKEERKKKRKEERKKLKQNQKNNDKPCLTEENQNKSNHRKHSRQREHKKVETVTDLDSNREKSDLLKQKSHSDILLEKNDVNQDLQDEIIEKQKSQKPEGVESEDKKELGSDDSDDSDSDNNDDNDDKKEWPQSIEKSSKWLLKERVIVQLALPNLTKVIQTMMANL